MRMRFVFNELLVLNFLGFKIWRSAKINVGFEAKPTFILIKINY